MKKLVWFAMATISLSIFNACEKGDDLIDEKELDQIEVKQLTFDGLDTIAFSVENNIFVFETEEDYQKCLDFLGTFEVEDYSLFEKEVGFNSLLSSFNKTEQTCPIEDEKFATLLNPNMQIIIEHYLFTLNHTQKTVEALFIGDDYEIKSANKSSVLEFSYDDDVFALLKDGQLKSMATDYCGQENSIHDLEDGIQTRLDYNKYGIYNSLVIKISDKENEGIDFRYETVNSPLEAVPDNITSRCFYVRNGKQNEIIYTRDWDYGSYHKKTIWDNRRRLRGFRLDILFLYKVDPPTYDVSTDRNMIECHQY
ncbi:MAG: hypothetical protein ACK5M7_00345 [Draconibacterium sp.]